MKGILYIIKTAAVMLALGAVACAPGYSVRHVNNNRTVVEVEAKRRCLLLPVEDGVPNAVVTVTGADDAVKTFRVALARTRVDYYVPFDLAPSDGRGVTVTADGTPFDAVCWKSIRLSDRFEPTDEPRYRPRYHHTPPYGWMNDPNGMVWLDGEYHLFYQYNPYGSRWENMSWGHSVSRDLIHWEPLPVALEPDSLGAIFSGCAVVDAENTAGFGPDALVAVYTAAGARQTQCLAYSLDRGRTFTKYAGNPVLTSTAPDFRDPKVFRHAESGRWIMVLAAGQCMEFYSSPDLKAWTFESRFGEGYGAHTGVWECPDLFELPVDGDSGRKRWVLLCSLGTGSGSKVQYFVGSFDGHTFTCDMPPHEVRWMDGGRDHYATVTWSDEPQGRRIALGWMNNWQYANEVPTLVFRSANTLPRELALTECDGEIVLASFPCDEVKTLCGDAESMGPFTVDGTYNLPSLRTGESGTFGIEMEISGCEAEVFGFKLFNCSGECVDFCFSHLDNTLSVDRTKSGQTAFSPAFPSVSVARLYRAGSYRVTLYVDRSSVETFVNGGVTAVTDQLFPSEPYGRMNFYAKGGSFRVGSLRCFAVGE